MCCVYRVRVLCVCVCVYVVCVVRVCVHVCLCMCVYACTYASVITWLREIHSMAMQHSIQCIRNTSTILTSKIIHNQNILLR